MKSRWKPSFKAAKVVFFVCFVSSDEAAKPELRCNPGARSGQDITPSPAPASNAPTL